MAATGEDAWKGYQYNYSQLSKLEGVGGYAKMASKKSQYLNQILFLCTLRIL